MSEFSDLFKKPKPRRKTQKDTIQELRHEITRLKSVISDKTQLISMLENEAKTDASEQSCINCGCIYCAR